MEKILVGMESKAKSLWPVIYALNLAKRMNVRLYILLVENPAAAPDGETAESENGIALKCQLESLILSGRAEGLPINYYITAGIYTDELIKFIQEKKINLLVIGFPPPGKKKGRPANTPELLKEISLRTNCRIEVVQQKNGNTGIKRS